MAQHNNLGNSGEQIAQKYLEQKGYQIKEINWRFGHLELDIIAQKDDWLVVVEVKTRSTDIFQNPEDAISTKKIRNIVKATNEYINLKNWQGETRFDIISIISNSNETKIKHIEDAFLPLID